MLNFNKGYNYKFCIYQFLQIDDKRSYHRVTLSKTEEMGTAIESDHISELTEEECMDDKYLREDLNLRGFAYIDAKYLIPFFTRRITKRVRFKIVQSQ